MRDLLLQGKLELPSREKFYSNFKTAKVIERMFISAWNSYLHDKSPINSTYWAKEFADPKEFNKALKVLSEGKWIISKAIPARNWAEIELNEDKLLEFVTVEELAHIRAQYKFTKYVPTYSESKHATLTKMNRKVCKTGLIRNGFKASSATPFQYDVDMLAKYQTPVTANVNKGMRKVRNMFTNMVTDEASYDVVSTEVVNFLVNNPSTYSMGSNFSDSRGRAIKEGLSKVANPIGYKDFRALLVIPEEYRNVATDKGATAIYMFIAELMGHKGGTPVDKELFGVNCYKQRKLHKLNLEIQDDRDELHENIWLERLYEELDGFYSNDLWFWSTPVEKDASASMMSHMGLLLGSKSLLEMTNTSFTGTFQDPWSAGKSTRKMSKPVIMPSVYGSSQPAHELLRKANVKYTKDDLTNLNYDLTQGVYAPANAFKEFILRWVKPKPEMKVHVYEDQFTVECNRFRNVGEATIKYDIYDTATNSVRRLVHTDTKRVPDLEQFRRFFVTCLIHGQDGQVLDFVMENVMSKYGWAIDIHDAIICCPESVEYVSQCYADELQLIYDNRESILSNYFNSIGIGAEAMEDWKKFTSSYEHIENFKASPYALK